MQDSNPEGLWNPISSRLNAADKPTELSRIKLKTWTRQPVPMISKHSAHLTPLPFGIRTLHWRYTYLLLLISMLWHRQAEFESKENKLSSSAECRIRTQSVSETQSPADWMPADKPTELSRIKLKTWIRQPVPMISKHSGHLTPLPFGIRTWLWRYTYLLLISMPWRRQAIFESKGDKLSSSAECRIRTQRVSETQSPADWKPADKPFELSRIKLKTWTRQPVPMFSKHSAHLTPLPFGIRTWLWRYTYVLLLISMLWHRQAIFEYKGDTLSSFAECRIRPRGSLKPNLQQTECLLTNRLSYRGSSYRLELDSPSLWPASIQPTWPHCHLAFAPG